MDINGRRRRTTVNVDAPEVHSIDDDFNDCMSSFLRGLKIDDKSDYTIAYYRSQLTRFMHTLEDMRIKTNLRAITREIIEDEYIRYLAEERRLKHASIASALRALRAFFNWAKGRGIIDKSPMDNLVIGEPKPPTIETFSRDQLRDLFRQPDPKMFVGLRDLAIMSVLLDTGVRVRELCDIKIDDVRLADRQILIAGKNGEQRLVPIQSQSARILKRYIAARGDSYVDWLFITVDDEQMNRDSVRRRIEKYGRQAGITNVRCSPHTFRHTFAKMSVQNGADLFTLQKILGHKTLDMVRRYVNMFSEDTKRAHERFSPMENLRIRF